MRREALAGAGAARTEGTLAASAGGGTQQHPAPGPPRAGGFPLRGPGRGSQMGRREQLRLWNETIPDSAIYLAFTESPRIISNLFTDEEPEAQKA